MSKRNNFTPLLMMLPFLLLSGCNKIGDKATSMSIIYGVTTVISLLLLVGYFYSIRKKEAWFIVLFTSVFVVNAGYLFLACSGSLNQALWANRISYLGSVFLPLSMIMIILKVTNLKYPKYLPYFLVGISAIVFLIAASPGYLDIYYKSVTLQKIDGVSVLSKEYGPWHPVYLFYLLGYLFLMASTTICAVTKKNVDSVSHAVILLVAVFVNICVWLIEQLVKIDFEFLSVSYIITELFLIGIYLMLQHQEVLISSLEAKIKSASSPTKKEVKNDSPEFGERCKFFVEQLPSLTRTESALYKLYLEGKSTKEVLEIMNIKENTLKFHNRNLYGKLGVSSRKELLVYAKATESDVNPVNNC